MLQAARWLVQLAAIEFVQEWQATPSEHAHAHAHRLQFIRLLAFVQRTCRAEAGGAVLQHAGAAEPGSATTTTTAAAAVHSILEGLRACGAVAFC